MIVTTWGLILRFLEFFTVNIRNANTRTAYRPRGLYVENIAFCDGLEKISVHRLGERPSRQFSFSA